MSQEIENLIREVLSEQRVQNSKTDTIQSQQVEMSQDLREVRDSTIRFSEYQKNHKRTHSWINKGLYAVAIMIVLGIVTGVLKTYGVL